MPSGVILGFGSRSAAMWNVANAETCWDWPILISYRIRSERRMQAEQTKNADYEFNEYV